MRRRNWKKINTQGVRDIHPARRGSFTARDLRSSLAGGLWQRLSVRRKQAAGAFLALALGAFLIVPSYAADFKPTDKRDVGLRGNVTFYLNGTTPYLPYSDGRITLGAWTLRSTDGSKTIRAYCADLRLLHNAGDTLKDVNSDSEDALFGPVGGTTTYREVYYIFGNYSMNNPGPGLRSNGMSAAIQLAIWGVTNGVLDNHAPVPQAGSQLAGNWKNVLDEARRIKDAAVANHRAYFLKETASQKLTISASATTAHVGDTVNVTAHLTNALPGNKVHFAITGTGGNDAAVDGNGDARTSFRVAAATDVKASVVAGSDDEEGAQGLQPTNTTMQFLVYHRKVNKAVTPAGLHIKVPAVVTPTPTPATTPTPSTPTPTPHATPTPTPTPHSTPTPTPTPHSTPTPTPTPHSTPTPTPTPTPTCVTPGPSPSPTPGGPPPCATPTPTPTATPTPTSTPAPTPTPSPACNVPSPTVNITGPSTYDGISDVTYQVTVTNGSVAQPTTDTLVLTLPTGWTADTITGDSNGLTDSGTDNGNGQVTFQVNQLDANQSFSVSVDAGPPDNASGTITATAQLSSTDSNAPGACPMVQASTSANQPTGGVQGISTTGAPLSTPSTGANEGNGLLRGLLTGLFLMLAGITILTGLRRNPHADY